MYKYISLVLIIAIGIFIETDFLGSIVGSLIEICLFLGSLYLIIIIWKENEPGEPENRSEYGDSRTQGKSGTRIDPVFDIKPASLKEALDQEPVIRTFIEDQFFIIWNFLLPHNGYVYHSEPGGSPTLITRQLRADLQWKSEIPVPAVLTLLDNKPGEILIENDLEPTSNLLPFYMNQDFRPRSLLGFKISISTDESLYFIFDADEPQFFNSEELGVIQKVIQTSAMVINLSLGGKGIQQQYLANDRKLKLSLRLNEAGDFEDALDVFTDFITEEFEASKLTIGIRCEPDAENEQAEIRKAVGLEDIFKKGYKFCLDEGLNGWVIQKNKPYLIDNIDKGDYFIPRFSKQEKTNYGLRSFLSVPLQNGNESLGMVTLEHKNPNQYGETHKIMLNEFVNVFSLSVPRLLN